MSSTVQRWAGRLTWKHLLLGIMLNGLVVILFGAAPAAQALPPGVNFNAVPLGGETLVKPTSLDFGPDGRLYVSLKAGDIHAYEIQRTDVDLDNIGEYTVTSTEVISLINAIPNYNDDGTPHAVAERQITGILATGTASNPVLYVSSSDYREGGGGTGGDLGLDTNSGIISRLTWTGAAWEKLDLVRGLPRSEENHSTNGMVLDEANNILYVASSGSTNAGAPSNNFAFTTEYALATAILTVDLNAIEALPVLGSAPNQYVYDLPTLDDPTRPGNPDNNDPFGGNDGLNQAKLVPGGPVQIYSPGYRNVYDMVWHSNGYFYAVDNGANGGWGGHPAGEGTANCTNEYLPGEPGSTGPGPGGDPKVNNKNGLHVITGPGYYAGHPNPIRGNPAGAGLYYHDGISGTWITSTLAAPIPLPADWPPVPVSMANPAECDFQQAGIDDGSLLVYAPSTNGITEYTASNFNGAMQGSLISAGYNGALYYAELAPDGLSVVNGVETFASNFGSQPLDVIAMGDSDPFPGSVWAVTYGANNLTIFEPGDFLTCTLGYTTSADEDGDGYTNADEIDNGTDECLTSDRPEDFDETLIGGFKVSNLNDPDDDDDGLADLVDPFPWDPANGTSTALPLYYTLFNADPGTGMYGLGFTGLMSNGSTDYLAQRDAYDDGIFGGTAGQVTLPTIGPETARGATNTQVNAFQYGFDVAAACDVFTIEAKLNGTFDGMTPVSGQSVGIYIGPGDQDNFMFLGASADDGLGGSTGGVELYYELGGTAQPASAIVAAPTVPGAVELLLYFQVDPNANTVQPMYRITQAGPLQPLGAPIGVPAGWLSSVLAVGIMGSSNGAPAFDATWDNIYIDYDQDGACDVPLSGLSFSSNGPVELGETSFFTATLSAGTNVEYTWEFGDGTTLVNGPTVSHLYAITGTFPVTVTATNGPGDVYTQTLSQNHLVNDPPPFSTLRINAGGGDYTDGNGRLWQADVYFDNGGSYSRNVQIVNTDDDPLYTTERWNSALSYSLPAGPTACYTVNLHYAEIWYGDTNPGNGTDGARVFDVFLEGALVDDDLDIHALVGENNPLVRSHYVYVSDGTINLTHTSSANNAKVSAIEVVYFGLTCPSPTSISFDSVQTRADVFGESLAWFARGLVALSILTLGVLVIRRREDEIPVA